MDFSHYKQEVYKTTLDLVKTNLIRLSSGNISVRLPDGNVAITPSAVIYADMRPEDIVIIDLNGKTTDGSHKPSSEKSLHLALYHSRPDIHAVVHTHSVYSIAFSSVDMELPLICLELISVGGPVPVAEYCCPGTAKVGEVAASFFTARPHLKGLLLKNHGMVAVGMNLQEAYQNAYNLETGAEIYHLALQTGKTPCVLSGKEVQELLDTYNSQKSKS